MALDLMNSVVPALLLLGFVLAFVVVLKKRRKAVALQPPSELPPPGSVERLLLSADHTLSSLPTIIEKQLKEGISARLEANIVSYLEARLEKAVLQSNTAEDCSRLLRASDGMAYFRKLVEVGTARRQASANQEGIAGGSNAIDVVALPIFAGELGTARYFVEHVLLPERGTPFWSEYVRGMASLLAATAYSPNVPSKLQGIEKHWALYLTLIQSITNNQNSAAAIEAISTSFQRYSQDKRIWQFGHIDPSGNSPVQWDCRFAYILEAARIAGVKVEGHEVQPSVPADVPASAASPLRPGRG